MRRFIVIGLGNFGAGVAESLYEQGNDVAAIDVDERAVDRIAPHVSRAAVGDGRDLKTLERLGARGADGGIVSTGDDITASVLATLALRDLEVKDIYVKVISRDHGRVMERIGVTETIFPERESALLLGTRLSRPSLMNYIQLGAGFSLQEMLVPDAWIAHSLRELRLRERYGISVIAIHDVLRDMMIPVPDPDAPLKESDTLLVAGREEDLAQVVRQG